MFEFAFDPIYRLAALPFGITATCARVTLEQNQLRIRFGPWRVITTLSNVAATEITGPFGLLKTVGPPHLSFTDRGLTCATNSHRGVCIRFTDPVRGLDPTGLLSHPTVTVTVTDYDELATVLAHRARPR